MALLAGLINLFFGLLLAWALVRYTFFGKNVVDALIDLPFALPTAVTGIALAALYSKNGWIGKQLEPLGINIAFTPWGILVALIFIGLPFVVRTVQPILEEIELELEEAAASLGASPLTAFLTVTLPQMKPGLISGFLFAFLISFDNYPISIFLVRGELTTLPIEVFNYISQNFDPTPAAFSTLYILLLSIVIMWSERRWGIISLSVESEGVADGKRRAQ
jgi:sulfate transport system permease protein